MCFVHRRGLCKSGCLARSSGACPRKRHQEDLWAASLVVTRMVLGVTDSGASSELRDSLLQQEHLPGEHRRGLWVPLPLECFLGKRLIDMGKESKNSRKVDR